MTAASSAPPISGASHVQSGSQRRSIYPPCRDSTIRPSRRGSMLMRRLDFGEKLFVLRDDGGAVGRLLGPGLGRGLELLQPLRALLGREGDHGLLRRGFDLGERGIVLVIPIGTKEAALLLAGIVEQHLLYRLRQGVEFGARHEDHAGGG